MRYVFQLLVAATIAFIVIAVIALRRPAEPPPPVLGPAPAFHMQDQTGAAFSSDDLRGKVWIADFVFTRCQGPCPLMTAHMKQLAQALAGEADVRFVSFTMDPKFDKPPVLAKYAEQFGASAEPRWRFVTCDVPHDMEAVSIAGFKLAGDATEGAVIHSARFILVDRAGRIRGYFDGQSEEM
ncbi:MAG TPA: SCO family protein, partial [Planctomycetota bacterium]|nr:SCO family protein [Planctomycetota bacterium]